MLKIKYEQCDKYTDKTCIKYTINYNTIGGVSGFFYDKLVVKPLLKKLAKKNLTRLQDRLDLSISTVAA